LQTALVAGLEHANKNWKHIFALPISRGAVYASKQVVALGMMGLSSIVLWLATIMAGLALRGLRPGLGFEDAAPVWPILKYTLLSYIASWLIVAIHTWIGMRWPSFVVAMSAGVAATVGAVVVAQSDYNIYYPWTLPAVLTREAILSDVLPYGPAALLALGSIACAIAGGFEFVRRDMLQ
jgi:lantibiotic transport system permease protein